MPNVICLVNDRAGNRPHFIVLFYLHHVILLWRVLKGRGPGFDCPQLKVVWRASKSVRKEREGETGWEAGCSSSPSFVCSVQRDCLQGPPGWVPGSLASPLLHIHLIHFRMAVKSPQELASVPNQFCAQQSPNCPRCEKSGRQAHLKTENLEAQSGRDMTEAPRPPSHILVPSLPCIEVSAPVPFCRVGAWLTPAEPFSPEFHRRIYNFVTAASY